VLFKGVGINHKTGQRSGGIGGYFQLLQFQRIAGC